MDVLYEKVAERLFEKGAIQFGKFELKHHEKNPDAPLSPFFINVRNKDNPTRPGPLAEKDFILIAGALWKLVWENSLEFQAVAGLPHAADPIIDAVEKITPEKREFRIIKLSKEITSRGRRIIAIPGFQYRRGEIVLLLDDLITKGDSKIEAIRAVEQEGSVVRDLAVLIDREQGGKEALELAGYNLRACFTISELMGFYLDAGYITRFVHDECLEYVRANG